MMSRIVPKKPSFGTSIAGAVPVKQIVPSESFQEINDLFTKEQLDTSTIPAKFLRSCTKYPEKIALLYKTNHIFGYIQYKRLLNLVENFTLSLEKLGIKRGDRVVIIAENRPEWAVVDLSVKSLGAILVPIHTTLAFEQIKEIIHEVEPAIIIVSGNGILSKTQKATENSTRHIPTILIDESGRINSDPDYTYDFISALKLLPHEDHSEAYKSRIRLISSTEVASIIYTPGATGRYIGVQLTHGNQVSNVEDVKQYVDINEHDRLLSILPLSHAFENTAGYYLPLFFGATISYLNELAELPKALKDFKPTVIMGVPRLYEKMYQRIVSGANQMAGVSPLQVTNDKLIYKKIKDMLGGNIRFLISGGAHLHPELGLRFNSLGIPILEGYGLTEASPIVSVNRLDDNRFGTVGKPLPNVKVRIAEDGEILLSGPSISPGYFKNDEENTRAFVNGWFKTGDLGVFDKDRFLRIIGKKKDIIVLSTGKNVSPKIIESQLTKSAYIEQAFVVGDGSKSIAALIVPNFENLTKYFPEKSENSLLEDKAVKTFFKKEIDKLFKTFAQHEQVKNFSLIVEPFNQETGTLTSEGNLIRKTIFNKYKREIALLYEKNLTAIAYKAGQ
ncbi:long-chain fatty acid--CoA ligase [Candidatus Aquicultor secundus]|uniref:AMP-dependent synthetase/ligase n=1 Tax=Candidatus Aquicultor secundus TaxID=1973895 RepID=UPI000CC69A15|nr:long-chain fatty acid--CoA ligase [Candidatus Aquicultor secundus]PIU28082.1 MAG: hypothetical protein COT10_00120 [Candidatus Aquicultor secundus]